MEVYMFKNGLLIAIAGVILSGFLSGCSVFGGGDGNSSGGSTRVFTFGQGNQIAISAKVINDCETRWLFGLKTGATKAELWLKFGIEDSEVFCLVPLNVGNNLSGNKTIEIKTPFKFKQNRMKTMTVELLDDDRLSPDEVDNLCKAAKATGFLLCDGANFYARKKGGYDLINSDTKKLIAECAAEGTVTVIKNMKAFDSLGSREFLIDDIADQKWLSIPLTIVDENDIARCDLKFHLVP